MHSLKPLPLMAKRQRSSQPLSFPKPQSTIQKALDAMVVKPRTSITKPLKHQQSTSPTNPIKWIPLNMGKSELFLPLTFPTGQTFTWKQTSTLQFTGSIGPHLFSLKQLHNGDVGHHIHQTSDESTAKLALLNFLNVGISLSQMWDEFSASDLRFAELAKYLGGARVLRQDPVECLIQFLCSSNNNIARITKLVDFISSLGQCLGTVNGLMFYEFPSLERLSLLSEQELRDAGFGYRAKYIIGTVKALQSKPGGGAPWLASLHEMDLQDAVQALSTLPGVGPKVAACIALFSLDQHHAIPVDTHVWQLLMSNTSGLGVDKIAIRHLIPELAGARLTPKLCSHVADAFVDKYGKYAGWAQNLLFIAELPSQRALIPSSFWSTKEEKSAYGRKRKTGSGNNHLAESFYTSAPEVKTYVCFQRLSLQPVMSMCLCICNAFYKQDAVQILDNVLC
ncbi:8-oxoguanine DNA glycosylase, N-terminal [Dillenia turbinata]|uniref:DNA-(apurinic or apyrimidinic site) lyase n=1 Tax=Dillenia turbinata TaxID=194707 RepID=A0AAN8VTE4_9MAGN